MDKLQIALSDIVETPRTCGDCTLCCKLLPVKEIGKVGGHRCQHQSSSKGCRIYANRPDSCRLWSCMWWHGAGYGLRRPDRSHFVIDPLPDLVDAVDNDTGQAMQWQVVQVW